MNVGVIEKIYTIQFLISMARVTVNIPDLTRFETRRTKDKNEIENVIKKVIQEQKTKKVPYFGYKEPVRAFTVKQHEQVNIDGKIFKTKNKNIARYNINISEDSEIDVTKHKVLKLGEIRYFMKKYNIKGYEVGGLLHVSNDHTRSDRNDDKLYFTAMSNEEWNTLLPENEVELKNLYVKVFRELNLFPYKNDVLDENLNLLVKVNSKAQR